MATMTESVFIPDVHKLVFGAASDSARCTIHYGASHTLYITGDISLRGTSVGDVLDFTNVTRAAGMKFIRMGTYASPTPANATGLFNAYSLDSADGSVAFLFFHLMRGNGNNALICTQSLIESESVLAKAPTSLIGYDSLVGLTQTTSCLATAGSDHTLGMFGIHAKVYSVDGATVAAGARAAAIWLDGQMNGANAAPIAANYYDIYATSGGNAFKAFAKLHLIAGEGAGWTNLFSTNFGTGTPPLVAAGTYKAVNGNAQALDCLVDINGTQYAIPLMAHV